MCTATACLAEGVRQRRKVVVKVVRAALQDSSESDGSLDYVVRRDELRILVP